MTDSIFFKHLATEILPESLYLQLEPHLDSIVEKYEKGKQLDEELTNSLYLSECKKLRGYGEGEGFIY